MARSRKSQKQSSAPPRRGSKRIVPEPARTEPTVSTDDAAECAFVSLPGPLAETLAVVRYTGRNRAYIHYGRAGDGSVFWYLIRSDGPRLLKVYPAEAAKACFAEMLSLLQGWQYSVNSDPRSPDYCTICPDIDVIEQNVCGQYLASAE